MPLLATDCTTGGAFVLDKKASHSASVEVEDGWIVQVRAGNLVVVARGQASESAEIAHSRGVEAVQRALDLLSMRGEGDLMARGMEDEHLIWWTTGGRSVLRAYAVSNLPLRVPGVTFRVTDAAGNEVPPPVRPEPNWHPSFRYFRLAQVSEEVFDAYRNLFLALESVLSTAVPTQQGERERDWIARALRHAQGLGLDLAPYARQGAVDPVAEIVTDLYSATRTATFHAKAGRDTLLPLDPVDRRAVLDSLSRLGGLYLRLADLILGARRPGSGFFVGGFNMVVGSAVDLLEVQVTDDPVRVSEDDDPAINPGGGVVKALPTRSTPELDQRFLRTRLGEIAVAELVDLACVTRIVATSPNGDPLAFGQLEATLTLGGFDVFEAALGVRGVNVNPPRSHYTL